MDGKDYKACLIELLIGLEVQNIDFFMSRCTETNCRLLGEAYVAAVKKRLETL